MCIITLSVQDNTLHTQRVSNYYTLYSKRPIFRVQSGKKLHQAENIYTDTVCGVCDKYEVWENVFTEKVEIKLDRLVRRRSLRLLQRRLFSAREARQRVLQGKTRPDW